MIYSNDTQEYKLVGITSFRNICTSDGIFTLTEPFINWITTTLQNPVPLSTLLTRIPITIPTPKPDVLGKFQILLRLFLQ
jgi:hypothetical protein